jgi:ribosomal protein S6--L-glutamate ligase
VRRVAIGAQLSHCENVITIGAKPNISDYHESEIELMRQADIIYYPTRLYADLFDSMGKRTFPNPTFYRYLGNKIKQTALFVMLGIPHPRTKVYYGERQKKSILSDFSFPFVAKVPRYSSGGKGVYLIRDEKDLAEYCKRKKIVYIQEYLKVDRDLRVVLINYRVVHAYWRIARTGNYRSNVSQGAKISFDGIPKEALDFSRKVTKLCKFDDVGLDVCKYRGTCYVLEANMLYGQKGFYRANLDRQKILQDMIEREEI